MNSQGNGRSALPNRTDTFSGLTMNINRVALPTVPCFLPQPARPEEVSSFVGQDDNGDSQPNIKAPTTLLENTSETAPIMPPLDVSHISTGIASKSGLRSRYVLPPDLLTTNQNVISFVPPTTVVRPGVETLLNPESCESHDPNFSTSSASPINSFSPTMEQSVYTTSSFPTPAYSPAEAYWFYATIVDGCKIWWPFSRHDSYQIETEAFRSQLPSPVSEDFLTSGPSGFATVPVEGGRYDVDIGQRQRRAVYWNESPSEIRRATWFYRLPDESRVLPFSEATCERLEARYKLAIETGRWGQPFELPTEDPRGGSDRFIFHSTQSMVQYRAWPHTYGTVSATFDPNGTQLSARQSDVTKLESHYLTSENDGRVAHVRRGLDSHLLNQLDESEHGPIDHVFFVIHGIGSIYNLRGQGLVECVNNLRRTTRNIERSHFPHHNNRVEFLPIMWHDQLHSDATGVDEQLNQISLRSIPKLRQFTNGTLMDILFYTSSKYCQVIVDTVATEICRLRKLFLSRNSAFKGGFSVIGHSLGSVIAFDLLSHQGTIATETVQNDDESVATDHDVEEVGFTEHPVDRSRWVHLPDGHLEEVVATGRSGRSSGFGGGTELEGWSVVGHQDNQREIAQPVGLSDNLPETPQPNKKQHEEVIGSNFERESPRIPSMSTTTEATKLADLLSRIGLNEDQIHKAVKAWLNESVHLSHTSNQDGDGLTSGRLIGNTNVSYRSFWVENHHAPISAGFGMPVVIYPQLGFPLTGLFMLGSPLPLFLTARGIRQLSTDYQLPQCPMLFNIFHPFDPVAYRMETLLDPTFQPRAVLIPHHKGGKRLHLRLKDNLARVGSDLKTKLFQSMHSTWRTLQDFASSHRFRTPPNDGHGDDTDDSPGLFSQMDLPTTEVEDNGSCCSEAEMNFNSQLNQGRRIDYVLQEAPLESFSDYIFALGSHAAYWESEDTALFLLTEAYSPQSVVPLLPGQKVHQSVPRVTTPVPSHQSMTTPIPMAPPSSSVPTADVSLIPPAVVSSAIAAPGPLDSQSDVSSIEPPSTSSDICKQAAPMVSTRPLEAHNICPLPSQTSSIPVTVPATLSSTCGTPMSHSYEVTQTIPSQSCNPLETVPPPPLSVRPVVSKASQTQNVPPFQAYRHVRPHGLLTRPSGLPSMPIFRPHTAMELATTTTVYPNSSTTFCAPTTQPFVGITSEMTPTFSTMPTPWLHSTTPHTASMPLGHMFGASANQQQPPPHTTRFAPPPIPPPPPPPPFPPFFQPFGTAPAIPPLTHPQLFQQKSFPPSSGSD